jgi:hypothetical protein
VSVRLATATTPYEARTGLRVLVLAAIGIAVAATIPRVVTDPGVRVISAIYLAATVSYLGVGWLLAERRRGNLVGPLVLALGMAFAGYVALDAFLRQPGLPEQSLAVAAALALSVLDGPLFLIVALLFLVFPDGRLPSSRWLILVASASLLASLTFLGALLRPGRFLFYAQYENPLDPPPNLLTDAWDGIYGLMVGCVVLAALSLVSRWRRADNVQRAQLKWAAAAATLIGIAMVTYGAGAGPSAYSEAGDIAVGTAFTLFPIAIGVAVLRYRLFEIDRIISRTLGWAIVTAILVASFAAIVVGLQAVLSGVTQGETLAVAASTLAAFALIQPLHRRVQRVVDRRFNRSRVNAERTIASFGERLRDEVDLSAISAQVPATANAAVQPTSAGLWLRRGMGGER